KAEGVTRILEAVEAAGGSRNIAVYLVDGRFANMTKAFEEPYLAAASNWHALARFASRITAGKPAMLIDIGSTTTDLVPIREGRPWTESRTDTERLATGELVYTGVSRTPICAVSHTLPWRGRQCSMASELFATTADAYVLLGDLQEQCDATWTADGRPL